MATEKLTLNIAEVECALWKKLEAHMNSRLASHRVRNDNRASAEDTAKLRGRIAEVKEFLKLAERQPTNQE